MGQMTCEYWMLKMAWDLLLASWLWVAAVMRLVMPSSSRSMACLQSVTTCCDKSDLGQKQGQRMLSNIDSITVYPQHSGGGHVNMANPP